MLKKVAGLAVVMLAIGCHQPDAAPQQGPQEGPQEVEASCFDRAQNGDESDVDCGGSCEPCAVGSRCNDAGDCQGGVCDQTCRPASCNDLFRNGDEDDIDCGGSCPACSSIESISPSWTVAGEPYAGLISVASRSSALRLELLSGPSAMTMQNVSYLGESYGKITWTPDETVAGPQTITVELDDGVITTTKTFQIEVLGLKKLASATMDAAGGTLLASEAASSVEIGLSIPPNVLEQAHTIAISSLTQPPHLPEGFESAGPIFDLSPTRLSFNGLPEQPPLPTSLVNLQEIADALQAAPRPVTLTISNLGRPDTGRELVLLTLQPDAQGILNWMFVDAELTEDATGDTVTLTASLAHFSTYAVATIVPLPKDFKEIPCNEVLGKIEALRQAWAVTRAATDHDFGTYAGNLLNPFGNSDLALMPRGSGSCGTHAHQLCQDLMANTLVKTWYTAESISAGIILAGASLPVPHYVAWLKPRNGKGPSFLLDRYTSDRMHIVRSTTKPFKPDPARPSNPGQWTYETLMQGTVDLYFLVRSISWQADAVFDEWEAEIGGPINLAQGISGIMECEDSQGARHPLAGVKVDVDLSAYGQCESGPADAAVSGADGAFQIGEPGDEVCFPCRVHEDSHFSVPLNGTLGTSEASWASGPLDVSGITYASDDGQGRVLWPDPITTTVTGRVVDDTGAAVASAQITLENIADLSATSQSDGRFSLADVPACGLTNLTVVAEAAGISGSKTATVIAGDITDVGDVSIGQSVYVVLGLGSTSVTVWDAKRNAHATIPNADGTSTVRFPTSWAAIAHWLAATQEVNTKSVYLSVPSNDYTAGGVSNAFNPTEPPYASLQYPFAINYSKHEETESNNKGCGTFINTLDVQSDRPLTADGDWVGADWTKGSIHRHAVDAFGMSDRLIISDSGAASCIRVDQVVDFETTADYVEGVSSHYKFSETRSWTVKTLIGDMEPFVLKINAEGGTEIGGPYVTWDGDYNLKPTKFGGENRWFPWSQRIAVQSDRVRLQIYAVHTVRTSEYTETVPDGYGFWQYASGWGFPHPEPQWAGRSERLLAACEVYDGAPRTAPDAQPRNADFESAIQRLVDHAYDRLGVPDNDTLSSKEHKISVQVRQ
jgi:hypothetical protein